MKKFLDGYSEEEIQTIFSNKRNISKQRFVRIINDYYLTQISFFNDDYKTLEEYISSVNEIMNLRLRCSTKEFKFIFKLQSREVEEAYYEWAYYFIKLPLVYEKNRDYCKGIANILSHNWNYFIKEYKRLEESNKFARIDNLNQFRSNEESLIKDFINDNKDKKEAALASKILDKGILAIVDEKERDNIIKLFSSNETIDDALSKNYNYLDSLY